MSNLAMKVAAALTVTSLISAPAYALPANPSSGSVSQRGDTQEFEGGPIGGANVSPATGSPVCVTGAAECDTYDLTVAPANNSNSDIRVTIEWTDGTNDLDIYMVDADGLVVGASATGANPEVFVAGNLPPGDYQIQILPFAGAEIAYTGLVEHLGVAQSAVIPPVSTSGKPRVIVGVIDSAINPYHAFYYQGSSIYPDSTPNSVTPEVLAELGVRPENHVVLTRTGDIVADIEADRPFWDSVQRGELYWFVGTNVVAAALPGSGEPLLVPTTDKSPHGVGTSSAVLKANPEAVILFVETSTALANDESHDLVFLHPAVDMVSTSYGVGVPGAPIGTGLFLPEVSPFRNSHEAVVGLGKLHFSSGGNMPGFTPGRAGSGPWWSIGVSGNEEGTSEGRTTTSGNFPDFVSDFTQELARCMDCESGLADYSGTSFSTPRAAGVASRVLLEARRKLGHQGGIRTDGEQAVMAERAGNPITNWLLRRSLEQAAYVPGIDEYDPESAVLDDLGAQPFNPAAPYLQSAWGDLTADPAKGVVEAALTHLDLGLRPRQKAVEFCDFQTGIIMERKQYWDALAGTAPAVDPFIFCESSLPIYPASNDPGGNFDAAGDADGDGVSNADDNCPEDANQDQADADADGYGDACDAPPPDADGDGIIDSEDNCPVDGNADQRDTGGDGTGDACETPPQAVAQPGPGRTLVAHFEGDGGTAATPLLCSGCGSGTDGFRKYEYRYELPAGRSYDEIEFLLTHEIYAQTSLEIYGPTGDQLALAGTDSPNSTGLVEGELPRPGDEPISDGELQIVLEDPLPGLYLMVVREQTGAADAPFALDVFVSCPETGCEAAGAPRTRNTAAGSAAAPADQSGAAAGSLGGLLWLTLLSLAAVRRRIQLR